MLSNIFDVTDPIVIDNGIQRYEYHGHEPEPGTNLNTSGEVRLHVTSKDTIVHPARSYLLVEGRLKKNDGSAYVAADKVTLINNGIMYLFDSIRRQLSEKTIEEVNHPGQATTMLGPLKYSRGFAKAQGLNQLWCKNTLDELTAQNQGYNTRQSYIISTPSVRGSFSVAIPLSDIFGFEDDCDKVAYGFKHSLIMKRASDNNAIIRDGGVAAGKVELTRIQWMMPHVTPSDSEKLPLFKIIEAKEDIPVAFRSRQCETLSVPQTKNFTWNLCTQTSPNMPRYITVGFQTTRDGDQTKNPAMFDHVKVNMIRAKLNTYSYPEDDYNLSFSNSQVVRAYRDVATLSTKLYGLNELITDSNISPIEYRSLYPLFVFDVSKQEEKLKLSSVDLKIEATFDENVPAGTQAYALVISDKICKFKSDGTKLNVIE
jgi:hypothetical protein